MSTPAFSDPDPTEVDPGNFLVRLLLVAAYFLILFVIRFVLWGVLLVQLLSHLLIGRANPGAQRLGQAVAEYIYRIWLFLTYSTHERPFPFGRRVR